MAKSSRENFTNPQRKKPSLAFRLFKGLLFFAGAAYLALAGVESYNAGKVSTTWPTTPGVILESEIEHSRNRKGPDDYIIWVTYRYEVKGIEYESSQGRPSAVLATFTEYEEAEEFYKDYQVQAVVDVHYNPRNHEEAVLIPGATAEGPVLILFAGVVFFIGVLQLFV